MERIPNLKGQLTRAWNSGKYTKETFYDYINQLAEKNNIRNFEWVLYLESHVQKLFLTEPKKTIKKPEKHQYNKWFVYFYFIDDESLQPIYIGKTYTPYERLKQHIREDKKYKNVKHLLIMDFDTEQDALDFEAYYTRYMQPEWNIDNKETPSSLYKLPEQKVRFIPINNPQDINSYEWRKSKEEELWSEIFVPKFQKRIHAISSEAA